MQVIFLDKIYNGQNIDEVFLNIWKDKQGGNIYSDNKNTFLRNLFEAIAMKQISLKMSQILDSQIKNLEDSSGEQTKNLEKSINSLHDFLEEDSVLQKKYLFAFAELLNAIIINNIDKQERNEINRAKDFLQREYSDLLDLLS